MAVRPGLFSASFHLPLHLEDVILPYASATFLLSSLLPPLHTLSPHMALSSFSSPHGTPFLRLSFAIVLSVHFERI